MSSHPQEPTMTTITHTLRNYQTGEAIRTDHLAVVFQAAS
jgi:hypothetical protein